MVISLWACKTGMYSVLRLGNGFAGILTIALDKGSRSQALFLEGFRVSRSVGS